MIAISSRWKISLNIFKEKAGLFSLLRKKFSKDAVKDYEKRLILEALEKSNWVKTKAAKLLNINRTTLVEKIKKQNLDDKNSEWPIKYLSSK